LLKGRDFESRGRSFKTQVNAFQFEKGDADSWTRLSHLRSMQPDAAFLSAFNAAWLKDFQRSLTVKSSLTIGKPGHPLFPEAVVHASVFHWAWALMPFNAKPALTVWDQRLRCFPKRRSTRQPPIGLWRSCGH